MRYLLYLLLFVFAWHLVIRILLPLFFGKRYKRGQNRFRTTEPLKKEGEITIHFDPNRAPRPAKTSRDIEDVDFEEIK